MHQKTTIRAGPHVIAWTFATRTNWAILIGMNGDQRKLGTPVAFEIKVFVGRPRMISQPGEIFLVAGGQDGGHRLGVPVFRLRGGRRGPATAPDGEYQGHEGEQGDP
ncbi:hypothetical protein GCM10029978_082780 [Actinoallomurus acanthiterrae]